MNADAMHICPAQYQYGVDADSDRGRLLLRPQPKQGESWPGYLVRVANANCLPSLLSLANIADLHSVGELLRSDPRETLRLLGIGTTTESAWAPYIRPKSLINRSGRKGLQPQRWTSPVCPYCLAADGDEPHIRSHWDWAMQTHCPVHKVLLVECCSSCNQLIDLRRPRVDFCVCGADLKQGPTQCSETATSAISRLLPEIDVDKSGLTFEREPLIHREAVRVGQWLSLHLQSNGKRDRRYSDPCLRLSIKELRVLESLTLEWPSRILQAVKSEVSIDSLASRTALGVRLYKRSFGLWQFILNELQKANLTFVNAYPAKASETYTLHSRHHIPELSLVTGHSPAHLKRQLRLGNLLPDVVRVGDLVDPLAVEIDEVALRKVQSLYEATLDYESAAEVVGASIQAMRGLISANCLRTESICRDTSRHTFKRVHPEDLTRFAKELFAHAQPWDASSVPEVVKFSDWVTSHAHGREHRYKRWIEILQSIRAGKLPLYSSIPQPVQLDQLLLSGRDLASVSDKRRLSHQCFC